MVAGHKERLKLDAVTMHKLDVAHEHGRITDDQWTEFLIYYLQHKNARRNEYGTRCLHGTGQP
jgi:hypothetical protein